MTRKHPNSGAGGGIMGGGAHLNAVTRAYQVRVDQRSVYPDTPKKDMRPLRCVRCDHVFHKRGDMMENGRGGLVCKASIACHKRQNGHEY